VYQEAVVNSGGDIKSYEGGKCGKNTQGGQGPSEIRGRGGRKRYRIDGKGIISRNLQAPTKIAMGWSP